MRQLLVETRDGLGNWEFFTHPHSNYTAEEWQTVFKNTILQPSRVQRDTPWHDTLKATLMGHRVFVIEILSNEGEQH